MNKKTVLLFLALLTPVASSARHGGFFDDLDAHFVRMQRDLDNMRVYMSKVFEELEEGVPMDSEGLKITRAKNNIKLEQKDDKAIVAIKFGTEIKNFDANIKTKKEGYTQDQLVITTKEPKKQKAVIKISGNLISIYQRSEVKKEEKIAKDKEKKTTIEYGAEESSFAATLDYQLNLQDANILYDSNQGTIIVEIPAIKKEVEEKGKKIDVKIK